MSTTLETPHLDTFTAAVLEANPRGFMNPTLFPRVMKRTAQRIADNIEMPMSIAQIMPSTPAIARPELSGRVRNIGGQTCIDGKDLTAINANFYVDVEPSRKVLAKRVLEVMDGGQISMKPDTTKATEIRVGGLRADRSMQEVADDLASPSLLKGVQGQAFNRLNARDAENLISRARDPEELINFKKTQPRTFALLSINKSLNFSLDANGPVVFNKERVVRVQDLEDSLAPNRLDKTIKDSKAPKFDMDR